MIIVIIMTQPELAAKITVAADSADSDAAGGPRRAQAAGGLYGYWATRQMQSC
jgi:hypothetical protein